MTVIVPLRIDVRLGKARFCIRLGADGVPVVSTEGEQSAPPVAPAPPPAPPAWIDDRALSPIHAAIMGAATEEPQTRRQLQRKTPYTDYSNLCKAVRLLVKKKHLVIALGGVCLPRRTGAQNR